ncbi:hypothetical protein DPMN_140091 [Dreissena polymorpha]|uniref:Uncharacterized protein n=1 Tax=Dreissena polymorpha TaxID=45954 RepID=A0A9D4G9T9_DREPO|nr:hypothetical protein DPMN_140091 [Dreissena polymorpha]
MWMNETVILIEEKEFRIVFRANVTKDGIFRFDSINILKACELLNITKGHIAVNHNIAYFRCDEGYRLIGNSSATCTEWTWSSEAPNCERIDCGTPFAPFNGRVISSSTTYGSLSNVSCNYGYFMNGLDTGVCSNNQKWSNENTTCLSINSTMMSVVKPGCSDQGWNITSNLTLLRNSFTNYMYNTEIQMYLGIASCKGSARNGFIDGVLVYDYSFHECMTRKKVSDNLNIFENKMVLRFDPENIAASTAFNWTLNVHCNAVDTNIITSISTNSLQSDANSISISVFSDSFFQNKLHSNPLHFLPGDTVYVKVFSSVGDPEIKLLLKSCYTRPALEKDSRLDTVLIQNGCEVESSTHVISVAAHEIQFMFQNYASVAFHGGIYVFCDVSYCNPQNLRVNCIQTCNGMLGPVIIG